MALPLIMDHTIVPMTQSVVQETPSLLEFLRQLSLEPPTTAPMIDPVNGQPGLAAPPQFAPAPSDVKAPGNLQAIINEAANTYGVPAELVKQVIKQESDFNPRSHSHAGAMGLMQLMPATARELGVTDPWDPRQNVMGGTKYLRQMYDKTHSWPHALAAYNAGPGRVIKNGQLQIPQIKETQDYVQKIMSRWGYR